MISVFLTLTMSLSAERLELLLKLLLKLQAGCSIRGEQVPGVFSFDFSQVLNTFLGTLLTLCDRTLDTEHISGNCLTGSRNI